MSPIYENLILKKDIFDKAKRELNKMKKATVVTAVPSMELKAKIEHYMRIGVTSDRVLQELFGVYPKTTAKIREEF